MRTWIWTGAALIAGGCAARPPENPFGVVQQTIARHSRLDLPRPPRLRGPADVPDEWLAEPLSIDSAVRITLAYNRGLATVYDELDIAQAELSQAGLLKNPVLDLSVRLPDRAPHGTDLEFGVSDSLVDLLLVGVRKRLAESALSQSQATASQAVIRTVADVRSAWFAAVAAGQMRALRQTILNAARAGDVAADALRQAGNVPPLLPLQTHAATLRATAELAAADADVVKTRAKLAMLLGLAAEQTHWRLPDSLPDPPNAEQVENLEAVALERRQDLVAAKQAVALAAGRLGVTVDTRFWNDLTVGVGSERETDGQWRVGPAVSVPIPLFDQGQAAIARARAQLQQSTDTYQQLRLDVVAQARSAQAEAIAARATALLYRDEVLPTQARLLNETQRLYNGMFVSLFTLLEARQTQAENEIRAVEALRDYWSAAAELDAAVGGRAAVSSASQPSTQPKEMNPMDMENMDRHMAH